MVLSRYGQMSRVRAKNVPVPFSGRTAVTSQFPRPTPTARENGTGTIFRPGLASLLSGRRGYLARHNTRSLRDEKWRQSRFSAHPQPRQGRPTRQPSCRPRLLGLRGLRVRRCSRVLSGPEPGLPGGTGTMVAERPSRIRRWCEYLPLRAGKPFVQPRARSVVRATTSRVGEPVLRSLTPAPVLAVPDISWIRTCSSREAASLQAQGERSEPWVSGRKRQAPDGAPYRSSRPVVQEHQDAPFGAHRAHAPHPGRAQQPLGGHGAISSP